MNFLISYLSFCHMSSGKYKIPKIQIPQAIHHILNSNWSAFEPEGASQMEKSINLLRTNQEFQQFPHARDVFSEHLLGTFGILSAWGYSIDITRAGLFHTGYSGDVFIFHYFDSKRIQDRKELQNVIGVDAERLVYIFGTVQRSFINQSLFKTPNAILNNTPITIQSRHGPMIITPEEQAQIMIITVADYLDQMVSVNGWRDIHQQETPQHLYPGSGKPEIAFFWLSRVCKGISPYLYHIPPLFNNCTKEINIQDEIKSRDLYWMVVTKENMNITEKQSMLKQCIELNPWIAEPHVLLSQLYYQQKKYQETEYEARIALDIFFVLSTCWDKRIPFRQWIAFTRMLHLRSRRKLMGLDSLPTNKQNRNLYDDSLVSLKSLFLEL